MSTTTYSYQISFDRQLTTFSHIIASIFQVAEFIKANYHNVSVTQTHHVGQIGLLERENAAILNESIKPLAKVTIEAFRKALDRLDLTCPFYLTQNDGTLIRYDFTQMDYSLLSTFLVCTLINLLLQKYQTIFSAEKTLQMPVHTFASGPTNSMRGAAFLSGMVLLMKMGVTCDILAHI